MNTLVALLVALALLPFYLTPASAQDDDMVKSRGIYLVGDAQQIGDWVRINDTGQDRCGAFWYDEQLVVSTGFETEFVFSISDLGGMVHPSDGTTGADGFAFVIQNHEQGAIGIPWHNIGYGGIPNCIAIEFDTWYNGEGGLGDFDPDGHHISVQTRGTQPNSPDQDYSLGWVSCPELEVETEHVAKIRYEPGYLEIYFDDLVNPILSVSMTISTILELNDGMAWIGFTGSTGMAWENHDILDWRIDGTPVSNARLTWGEVKALYR